MLKSYLRHRMADRKVDDVLDVMKMAGVSRNSVNKLFRDKGVETMKIETLMRICDALECDLSQLVEYKPDSKTKS